jgi:hypothetical protein
MKKFINDNWFKLGVLAALIFIIAFSGFMFYWFEIRPNQIRKYCYNDAIRFYQKLSMDGVIDSTPEDTVLSPQYKECLIEKGLKD